MPTKRLLQFTFLLAVMTLALPVRVLNFNLFYWNWTHQSHPLMSKRVVAFENCQDCGGVVGAITASGHTWDGIANFRFPRLYQGPSSSFPFHGADPDDSEIQIGWAQCPGPYWDPAWDPNWVAATVTWVSSLPGEQKMIEADIVFNDSKDWSTNAVTPPGKVDVQATALHELGHVVGLMHSVEGTIMSYAYTGGKALDDDAKLGLRAIYDYKGWRGASCEQNGNRLTSNYGYSVGPKIAVGKDEYIADHYVDKGVGNVLHVVWCDNNPGNYEIFYQKYSGLQWSSQQQISSSADVSAGPEIACDTEEPKQLVYIVWLERVGLQNDLYFRCSEDGGATWGTPTMLTNNEGESTQPAIAVTKDHHIHVVWADATPGVPFNNPYNYEVFYRESIDRGQSWLSEQRLTFKSQLNGWCACSSHPDIAPIQNNQVFIAWSDNRELCSGGNIQIYCATSLPEAPYWSQNMRVTSYQDGWGCFEPDLAIADDNWVHLVFTRDMPDLNWDIIYLRSTDNGTTWGEEANLSIDSDYSEDPHIACGYLQYPPGIDKKYAVHVAWIDDTGGHQGLFYCGNYNAKAPSGYTWEKSELTTRHEDLYGTDIAAYGYNIHLVYSQILGSPFGYDITYLRNMARLK